MGLIRGFLLSSFILFTFFCDAQIKDGYLITQAQGNNLTKCDLKMTVLDTLNIDSIHVNIGVRESDSSRVNYTFKFDSNTNLPISYIYSRNGYNINLDLGLFDDNPIFFIELTLLDLNGIWSNKYVIVSN